MVSVDIPRAANSRVVLSRAPNALGISVRIPAPPAVSSRPEMDSVRIPSRQERIFDMGAFDVDCL